MFGMTILFFHSIEHRITNNNDEHIYLDIKYTMVALLQCTLLQPLEGGTVPALQAVLGGAPDDVHHGAVLGAVARHQVSCRHQRHRATRGLARRPAQIIS